MMSRIPAVYFAITYRKNREYVFLQWLHGFAMRTWIFYFCIISLMLNKVFYFIILLINNV